MSNQSTQYRMCTVHGYEGGMRVSPYAHDTHPSMNFGSSLCAAIREHIRGVKEQMQCEYWCTVSTAVAMDTHGNLPADVVALMRECADAEAGRLGMVR